ncbi:MAG: glycosyltransferase [Planctomycetes bacterium]|nr:glycosyltransferase [Planctomycetota bacterium]
MRVWVVLPAYNEAANLPALLAHLGEIAAESFQLDVRVLVVDDGSTDDTAAVAARSAGSLSLEVIRNEKNLGLAGTFLRGMTAAAAQARAGDVVVCMDADNSHVPGQMLAMIRGIQEGRDVVIASRYQPGAVVRGVPWSRRVLSSGMSVLFRLVCPIQGVRDYSCGYRAYRAKFLQDALAALGDRPLAEEGFACMVEMLLHLARRGAIFGEVPLVLRYDRKVGASKMKVGRTVVRTLAVLVRERLSSPERGAGR